MAKKNVTLTAEQWDIVTTAVRRAPAGADVETQYRQNKLRAALVAIVERGETTVGLLNWQRTMIDGIMASPSAPWAVEGITRVWAIREAFGFVPPSAEDYDDEEEEETEI